MEKLEYEGGHPGERGKTQLPLVGGAGMAWVRIYTEEPVGLN